MAQDNIVLFRDLDHLLLFDPNIRPGYIYVGDGKFLAFIVMNDVGERLVLADSGLALYRKEVVGIEKTRRYMYDFHPDTLGRGTVRKTNWMHWFRLPLGLLGCGPNRPASWIDEHPFFLAYPVGADILLQTGRVPAWNRIKPLTEAGLTWVRSRSDSPGSDFTILLDDGTLATIPPQGFGLVAQAAEADGLSVWVF